MFSAKNYLWYFFTISLSVCLLFPLVPTIAADDKPPPTGRSSGGRGCGMNTATTNTQVPSIILLSPKHQRGQTTLLQPTFAWFMRDASSRSLQFQLYEVIAGQYQLIKQFAVAPSPNSSGILALSSRDSDLNLEVGKRYRWQVEVICNPNRPSSNLFAAAELDVVTMPVELKQRSEKASDRAAQIRLLEQANLWYDAFDKALLPEVNPSLNAVRSTLLNRVALNEQEHTLLTNSKIYQVLPQNNGVKFQTKSD